jgi:hypothetical protein
VHDPHTKLRMAAKVLGALENHLSNPESALQTAAQQVRADARLLKKPLKTLSVARRYRWSVASAHLQEAVISRLRQIYESAGCALEQVRSPSLYHTPTLRDVYEEIGQLESEFDNLKLNLKSGVISAETEAIELEGVYLGPFRIKLDLADLGRRISTGVFLVEALDPQPAASDSETVHPHVQGEHLCAGDATLPVTNALREGRLADAFLAINSVLHTYNAGSPYVALDDWFGVKCSDCGELVDEDSSYTCDGCGSTICDSCSCCCDQCGQVYCGTCLERTDKPEFTCLCEHCRGTCRECQKLVASKSLKYGLCPTCFKQHQTQEKENTHDQLPIPTLSDPAHSNSGEEAECNQSSETAVPAPA